MKHLFQILVLILLVFSQTHAQKAVLKLEISPQNPSVGEVIQVTIRSNISGNIEIDYPAAFVHGYNIMNGMNQEIDYNTGKIVTYTYMSESGTLSKPGTYTFGPAYIKKGSKIYKSNTVSITVKKESNISVPDVSQLSSKQLKQPAFGIIERSKATIYEGEPVVINSKVYATFNPTQIENYQTYNIDGVVEKHEISSLSDQIMVDQERLKQRTYYTFTCDKQVVFPTGIGKVAIDPFKLILISGFESLPITSAANSITIKPLPKGAPSCFIGVVGKLSSKSKVDINKVKQGEVITLTIELEGSGNLHNAIQPNLKLPKYIEQYGDVVVKEELDFGINGAQGKLSYTYHLRFNSAETKSLPAFPISYFDPKKEEYVILNTEDFPITVIPVKNFKPSAITAGNTNTIEENRAEHFFPYRSNESAQETANGIHQGVLWSGVFTPIALSVIAGLYFRKKRTDIRSSSNNAIKLKGASAKHTLLEAKIAIQEGDIQKGLFLLEKSMYAPLEGRIDATELLAKMDKKSALECALRERGISEETISTSLQLIGEIEQQRYGFLMDTPTEHLLQQVETICTKF